MARIQNFVGLSPRQARKAELLAELDLVEKSGPFQFTTLPIPGNTKVGHIVTVLKTRHKWYSLKAMWVLSCTCQHYR
jgi:hypothetical protein